MDYRIIETDDFLALSTLFHNSGMGVPISERKPERIIKMWRMENAETGELMAAVTLEKRDGVFSLGDIAVNSSYRQHHYGNIMQNVVFDEARKMNVSEIWACARLPEYYLHCGWEAMDWDASPNIAVYCTSCGKRGTECHPEIMRYTL
ncbi:MAG: hypothetical protein IJU45_06575 [Clostridia bacterium]|nr:hypothetical protein [Clostridia bacterium]